MDTDDAVELEGGKGLLEDEDAGDKYYYNSTTGETSREMQEEGAEAEDWAEGEDEGEGEGEDEGEDEGRGENEDEGEDEGRLLLCATTVPA